MTPETINLILMVGLPIVGVIAGQIAKHFGYNLPGLAGGGAPTSPIVPVLPGLPSVPALPADSSTPLLDMLAGMYRPQVPAAQLAGFDALLGLVRAEVVQLKAQVAQPAGQTLTIVHAAAPAVAPLGP